MWIKSLLADANAIKAEKDKLAEREKALKNKADSLKKYLDRTLNGSKFETPKVSISYRKSSSVEVDENFIDWARENAKELLTFSDPTASKTAIKDYLKTNQCEYARMVPSSSMSIK